MLPIAKKGQSTRFIGMMSKNKGHYIMNKYDLDSFDKRWVRGKIHEYVAASLNHSLANSPQKLHSSLEILEEPVRVAWLLSGVIEIEDRKFDYSYIYTQETETRSPRSLEQDPFKFAVKENTYRHDFPEPLPDKDAVVICRTCFGNKQLTSKCQSCDGTGQLTCLICNGQKHRTVACRVCGGHKRVPVYPGSDTYILCSACERGFVTEGCTTCHETGVLASPCPNCERGQVKSVCLGCEGTGLQKQIASIRIRNWSVPINPVALEPTVKLNSSLPGTLEPIFTTPFLSLEEMEMLNPHNLPQNVWQAAKAKLREVHDEILLSYDRDDEGLYKNIKRIQVSIYSPAVVQARFLLKGRPGMVWIALGNDKHVLDYTILQYSLSFWDYATELSVLLSILFLGAGFSWLFESVFPLLTITFGGVLLFWVIRNVRWQDLEGKVEFASQFLKILSFLMTLGGIALIMGLFIQMIGIGDVSSLVFPLIMAAIITALGTLGIFTREQFSEILRDLIKTFSKGG
jgi:hypothetical protein